MDRVKIKICGLFRPIDIAYANQVRPDYVGFILAPNFRRSVTRRQAAQFRQKLDSGIQAVGVFVNPSCEEVVSYLDEGIIQMAQLHGAETEDMVRCIRAASGRAVAKAVKVRERRDVEAWLDSAADYLMFDGGMGGGVTFDWSLLADIDRAYFLAGGLNADNLEEALKVLRPYGVDLSSGVETDGVKDKDKMQAVVDLVRRHSD